MSKVRLKQDSNGLQGLGNPKHMSEDIGHDSVAYSKAPQPVCVTKFLPCQP